VGLGLGYGLASGWDYGYPYDYGYGYGYPGYAYGNGYPGYGVGYGYPGYAYSQGYYTTGPQVATTAPLVTGRSVAEGVGDFCTTPVKKCELYHPSNVGAGCSCRVSGGRASGSVTP
jgi:hypothetical protein